MTSSWKCNTLRCSSLITTRTDYKCCMALLQPRGGGGGGGVKREVGLRGSETNPFLGEKERGQRQIKGNEVDGAVTVQCLQHAASPDSHTLPAALGWKRTFGSRGRPRSPARGGKEALTECAAVPLCRPHRTSHLGRGVREHSPHHYQCDSSDWDQPLRSERAVRRSLLSAAPRSF